MMLVSNALCPNNVLPMALALFKNRHSHKLFEGSLKLLLTKQHVSNKVHIAPKYPKCGLINQFELSAEQIVAKTTDSK